MPKTPPQERKSTEKQGGYAERLLERVRRTSIPKRPSITDETFNQPIETRNYLDPKASSSETENDLDTEVSSSSDKDILTLTESTINPTTPVKHTPLPVLQTAPKPAPAKRPPLTEPQTAPKPSPPERFSSFDAWIEAVKGDCAALRASCKAINELESAHKDTERLINPSVDKVKPISSKLSLKAATRYTLHRRQQDPTDNEFAPPVINLIAALKKDVQQKSELQKNKEQLATLKQELAVRRHHLEEFGLPADASVYTIDNLERDSLIFINDLKNNDRDSCLRMVSPPTVYGPFHPDITKGRYKEWLTHLDAKQEFKYLMDTIDKISSPTNTWQTHLSKSTSQEELAETAKPVRRVTYAEGAQPPSTQEAPKKSAFYL